MTKETAIKEDLMAEHMGERYDASLVVGLAQVVS
jgi:hypothetical protein